MDRIFEYSSKLISSEDTSFLRYKYHEINWNNRLIGLISLRGVGKTTLVLQYIKNNLDTQQTLFVTAEDFYFADNRLIDLADDFVKFGGKNKGLKQIKNAEKGFLVKDNIEKGFLNTIPLWHFGWMY